MRQKLEPRAGARFDAVGSTDTEQIFCELLERIADQGRRSLGDADPEMLREWFVELNALGSLTTCLTDGRDLVVYADAGGEDDAYVWEIVPPFAAMSFGDEDLTIDLVRRGVKIRKGVVVCSNPLHVTAMPHATWRRVAPGICWWCGKGRFAQRWRRQRTLQCERTRSPRARAVERSTHTLRLEPAEVYGNRYGVCQDFTNLFICLARLLSVPARYVCGYIYTGATHANHRQGDAAHAWVHVYLPEVGWRVSTQLTAFSRKPITSAWRLVATMSMRRQPPGRFTWAVVRRR